MKQLHCLLCLVLATICSLLMVGCGYDDFSAEDWQAEELRVMPNSDISLLRSHYAGGQVTIPDNIVIEGRVTANDRSGNFYRSIIIEDGTGAVELLIDLYDLHNIYRRGQRIVVCAEGLAMGSSGGVLQIGRHINPWSTYRVEGFSLRAEADRYILRDVTVKEKVPVVVTTDELSEGMCGRLVRVNNLTLSPAESSTDGWAESVDENPYSNYSVRFFHTSQGDSIAVVTSSYADFAERPIPEEPLSLSGILLYGPYGSSANRFAIKLRDSLDYALY